MVDDHVGRGVQFFGDDQDRAGAGGGHHDAEA
jgi:hypothetical protein